MARTSQHQAPTSAPPPGAQITFDLRNTPMESRNANRINCFQCVYFAITWEPRFPRACRLFGFKTAQMPSMAVLRSSGAHCKGFVRKEKKENP